MPILRKQTPIVVAVALLLMAIGIIAILRPDVPDGPLPEQIDSVMQQAHRDGHLSGNVLVARGDGIVYERSFGLADVTQHTPNQPGTKFPLASVSKPFTAVLVMQLVESGRLALDAKLASLFPQLAGRPAGEISIHQLLTHTSGIEEVISRHPYKRITPADLETAAVAAGGAFNYSNTGYVCLALVIEAVTGGPFDAVMDEQVFAPAGMRDSGVMRSDQPVAGLASGYRTENGAAVPAELGFAPEAVDGAGSLYSTARDLMRFDQALKTNGLLAAESRELMLRQHIRGRFGYGWFLNEQGGRYFPWHVGEIPGYRAAYVRQVNRDEIIVILANHQESDAGALRSRILRLLKRSP